LATEHGFVQDQALANELTARFCLARGLENVGQAYLRDAREGYRRWDAFGKLAQLDQLDQSYPGIERPALSDRSDRVTVAELPGSARNSWTPASKAGDGRAPDRATIEASVESSTSRPSSRYRRDAVERDRDRQVDRALDGDRRRARRRATRPADPAKGR
jgi:GAF domain-containing protein